MTYFILGTMFGSFLNAIILLFIYGASDKNDVDLNEKDTVHYRNSYYDPFYGRDSNDGRD